MTFSSHFMYMCFIIFNVCAFYMCFVFYVLFIKINYYYYYYYYYYDLDGCRGALKRKVFIILFLSEFVNRQVQTNINSLLAFEILCSFLKNIVYIFPPLTAFSGWCNKIFLVNSSKVSCLGSLITFSLLESWYVASKPVCGPTLYKLKSNALTSSLKLSVLCKSFRIGIVCFWLAHCES